MNCDKNYDIKRKLKEPLLGATCVHDEDELDKIREKKLKEMEKKHLGKGMGIPVEITDRTFEDTVRKYPAVVVDLWAPWCSPCRMIAPVVEELAKEYLGRVVFGKMNVDENRDTSARYGVMSIPTLLFFKNGELMDQITGALPKQALEERIRKII